MTKGNKIKSFFKKIQDLSYLGSSNILGAIILSIFWIFLASLLGPENYGEISYLIAIANIVSVIAFLGAGQTITVYVAKGIRIENPIYVISLISSIVTSIVIFLILESIEVSLYVIGYVIFGLVTHELLGLKLFKIYSKLLILQRILTVGLALGFYFLIGLEGIVLGYAIAFLPFAFFLYKGFKESKLDFSILKPRLGFMMNNYGKDLAKILSRTIDKIIIFPIFGAVILGNYQLGFQVLVVLTLIPSIVYQYTLPRESSGDTNYKLQKGSIIVSIVLTGIIILFGPTMSNFFFPKFIDAINIIQIMSVAIIPISISYVFTSKFLAIEKSKFVIIGSGIFLIIQISLIFSLGKVFEITGIAMSLVIAASVETVFLAVSFKLYKNKINKKSI